jgi:hypothetical protein
MLPGIDPPDPELEAAGGIDGEGCPGPPDAKPFEDTSGCQVGKTGAGIPLEMIDIGNSGFILPCPPIPPDAGGPEPKFPGPPAPPPPPDPPAGDAEPDPPG